MMMVLQTEKSLTTLVLSQLLLMMVERTRALVAVTTEITQAQEAVPLQIATTVLMAGLPALALVLGCMGLSRQCSLVPAYLLLGAHCSMVDYCRN